MPNERRQIMKKDILNNEEFLRAFKEKFGTV